MHEGQHDDGGIDAGAGRAPDDPWTGGPTCGDGLLRREFVVVSGGAAVSLLAAGQALGAARKPKVAAKKRPLRTPRQSIVLRRREDLLWLRIDFANFTRDAKRPGSLKVGPTGVRPTISFTFPPQAVGEQAYWLASPASKNVPATAGGPKPNPEAPGTQDVKAPGTTRAVAAGPTTLVFGLPKGKTNISVDIATLLNWSALVPLLARAAGPDKTGRLTKPQGVTLIEAPWRLVLSPTVAGRWAHRTQAQPLGGWTPVWHTDLVTPSTTAAVRATAPKPSAVLQKPGLNEATLGVTRPGGSVRAIWAYDRGPKNASGGAANGLSVNRPPDVKTKDPIGDYGALTPQNRWSIVKASGHTAVTGRADVRADRLRLSSLGATLDLTGIWDLPLGKAQKDTAARTYLNILLWRQLSTLGRDHYVRVVEKGYLYPFGHRAVYVTVTERRFERNPKTGTSTAVLRKHAFVVVIERERSYRAADHPQRNPSDSRDFPFRAIRLRTEVSPNLDAPKNVGNIEPTFVPFVAGTAFAFEMTGIDWRGRTVDFAAPAVYVPATLATKPSAADPDLLKVRDRYYDDLRKVDLRGASVAMAASATPGDTDVELQTVTFGAREGSNLTDANYAAQNQPSFFPKLIDAEARMRAAEAVSGTRLPRPKIEYHGPYVGGGFAATAGQVFVQLTKDATPPAVNFGGGTSGGVITPNLLISGLSRSLGPVSGAVDEISKGTFNPFAFFKDITDAKLLGGITLGDLLLTGPFTGDAAPVDAMKITQTTTNEAVDVVLTWRPKIKSNPFIQPLKSGGELLFALDANSHTDLINPGKSTARVEGLLQNFVVTLLDNGSAQFIAIEVPELRFNASEGQAPVVKVKLGEITFKGPLEFIEKLREFMATGGGTGAKIDVSAAGIKSSLDLALPDLTVGVFALSKLSISTGFNLPFDGGEARFRFAFCDKADKFCLQVGIFGGGGYFGIALGTNGIEFIEAAFEFGATSSMDFGPASGEVHLMAGIYFGYGKLDDAADSDPETCVLTGYVRMGGSLDVLGLITASLEFMLSLTYSSAGGKKKVTGEATLTISVEVLVFSGDVSITARRSYGNGPDDPPFRVQVPKPSWDQYCAAFA